MAKQLHQTSTGANYTSTISSRYATPTKHFDPWLSHAVLPTELGLSYATSGQVFLYLYGRTLDGNYWYWFDGSGSDVDTALEKFYALLDYKLPGTNISATGELFNQQYRDSFTNKYADYDFELWYDSH